MKNWITSFACQSRAHCSTCLTDAEWRKKVKAPDVCPYGVTLDNRKGRRLTEQEQELLDSRIKICESCEHNKGIKLDVKGYLVNTVKCAKCSSCSGNNSLLHGVCKEGKWP